MKKRNKYFCYAGSALLLFMAIFHGSGFNFVKASIESSNADSFLKDIVPALFAHPSIHLMGLTAFGLLSTTMEQPRKVLVLLALLIFVDAALGFYLGGLIPGAFLSSAAILFILAYRL
ncbi:MAG: hypothetical protein AAGI23_09160 [Bacteroidota bacterium]